MHILQLEEMVPRKKDTYGFIWEIFNERHRTQEMKKYAYNKVYFWLKISPSLSRDGTKKERKAED